MAIPDEKRINGDMAEEVRCTITEQQKAEEEQNQLLLRERAARVEAEAAYQRLYNLFMQAPALICFLRGPQHVYELANPIYLQTIGHRNPIGKPIREALPELEGQGIFELLDSVYTSGKPFIGNEVKVTLDRRNDGILEDAYFNFVYQPSRNSNGEIEGILVHAMDITEQVLARHKVQESEARLQRLIDSNIIGIIFTDIHSTITEANDTFLQMVGYTREDWGSGRINWADITPPEYTALDEQAMQEMQRHGAVASPYEKEYIASDGRRIPVLVGGALVDIAKGECMAFVIDIRAQKKMEEELRKAKEQLEAILHTAADGITAQDIDGTILYVNDIAARVSGFSSAEAMLGASPDILKQTVSKFVMKDEEGNLLSTEALPGRRALRGEKNVRAIIQYVNKATDHIRWSLVKAEPIFNDDGRVQFVVNVITDISEQQELEQRKNEFIGMASHELKTPVTALKGFTNILQRRATKQGDEQALHYLARMDSQLNKLTRLVSNLLDISKMQAGKLVLQEEAFDLAELIYESVENLQETSSTHQLQIEEMVKIPIIGDRDRIGQVLINLLTNAIKYSPHADKVIVRASKDGEQVIVSVQDFGIGIAENYHQQIFDRFYQVTDPEEKTYPGLGIGLYISCEIVERHGGRIWVESAKGKGATFFFTLPG